MLPAVDDSLCSISGKTAFLFVGKPSLSKAYALVVVLGRTAASRKNLVCGLDSFSYMELHLQQNIAYGNS